MKRSILFIATVAFFHVSQAQVSYKLTYEIIHAQTVDTSKKIPPRYFAKTVSNDSMFFCYFYKDNDDCLSGTNSYGGTILHHAQWYNFTTGMLYNGVSYNVRKPYLVKGKMPVYNWVTDTAIVYVYDDQPCKKAYALVGEHDSCFAIYSPGIPVSYNNYTGKGLPGMMLEFVDTRNGLYVKAVKVEKGIFDVTMPLKGRIRKYATEN